MKFVIALLLLSLSLGLTPALAEDKKKAEEKSVEVILPDLWPAEIKVPKALTVGSANEVRVVVENRAQKSKVEGKIKIELVVIQADPTDRASYFAEVDGMSYGQKKEALFTGIEVKNDDTVRLLAIVDPEKQIKEANAVNNRKIFQVWIPKVEAPPEQPSNTPSEPPTDDTEEPDTSDE